MQPADSGRVLLGRIAAAHGLKGEVKIATFTAAPEDIAAYGPLIAGNGVRIEIVSLRTGGGGSVIARLRGVGDRTQAEALRGTDLYVPRDALPAAGDGEYYHSDLIGLAAVTPEGEALGEIVAIQNFGAGDLLEIRAPGGRKSELIPFEQAFVPTVDIQARRVTIVRPVFETGENTDAE
jgi:16S rRNA processing protein RimM